MKETLFGLSMAFVKAFFFYETGYACYISYINGIY